MSVPSATSTTYPYGQYYPAVLTEAEEASTTSLAYSRDSIEGVPFETRKLTVEAYISRGFRAPHPSDQPRGSLTIKAQRYHCDDRAKGPFDIFTGSWSQYSSEDTSLGEYPALDINVTIPNGTVSLMFSADYGHGKKSYAEISSRQLTHREVVQIDLTLRGDQQVDVGATAGEVFRAPNCLTEIASVVDRLTSNW